MPYRTSILACMLAAAPLYADMFPVGKYSAKIVPEQATTLSFSGRGEVTDTVRTDSKRVEKDTVIGIINKVKTEEDREDMELQLVRERLTKRDEIRKLQAQRKQLQFFLKLSPNERVYAKDAKSNLDVEPTPEALKDVDERIDLLQKELSTIERRKRKEFDAKHEKDTLRMPFTGRLQYHVTLPENPEEPYMFIPSATGTPFASVCDDSAFYITLSVSNPALTFLPEERFSVYLDLPDGKRITGVYDHHRVEKTAVSDMLTYYFKVAAEDHDTVFNLIGTSLKATLVYSVEEDVERVPKMQLLTHPEAKNCEDWKQLVSAVYPGSHVVLITDHDLLISKKKQAE